MSKLKLMLGLPFNDTLRVGRDSNEKVRLMYSFNSVCIQPLICLYPWSMEIHHIY